jgi:hypothetical protein
MENLMKIKKGRCFYEKTEKATCSEFPVEARLGKIP